MAYQVSYTGKLVIDYLARYKDKLLSRQIGKLTLARLIYYENKTNFPGLEQQEIEGIRRFIRYYTGTLNRNKVNAANFYLNNDNAKSEILENLKQLPDSWASEQDRFILPDGDYLVISDVHLPYHSIPALEYAIEYGVRIGVSGVLMNGDIIDMWQLSDFVQIGHNPTITDEIKIAQKFFAYLREKFPTQPIYYKMGNHEQRWERYIWRKAPELASLLDMQENAPFGLVKMLNLEAFGIHYLRDKCLIQAGGLSILHGHEFGSSVFSPVNPARGAFMRAKSSIMISHHHQTSEHSEGNLIGEEIDCFSLGCLCELTPGYRPFAYTKWNWGAARVQVSGNSFDVDNFRIKV